MFTCREICQTFPNYICVILYLKSGILIYKSDSQSLIEAISKGCELSLDTFPKLFVFYSKSDFMRSDGTTTKTREL